MCAEPRSPMSLVCIDTKDNNILALTYFRATIVTWRLRRQQMLTVIVVMRMEPISSADRRTQNALGRAISVAGIMERVFQIVWSFSLTRRFGVLKLSETHDIFPEYS